MAACLMAYNGWSYVSFVAGEVTDPQRNLPKSLALGMGVVMVLYVGANLAYMNVMTVPQIAAAERVGWRWRREARADSRGRQASGASALTGITVGHSMSGSGWENVPNLGLAWAR